MKKFLTLWILPVLISTGLFVLVRPALAQFASQDIDLSAYLLENDVAVGTEPDSEGFRQIYYEYNGNKKLITTSRFTNSDPVTDGEFIVWMAQEEGGWRVYRYHIITGTTTKLSEAGINVNPRISGNNIVWERQVEGRWQIMLFDGATYTQVTGGDGMALNPDIDGGFIVYDRKDAIGGWGVEGYSISEKKKIDVTTAIGERKPDLQDGKLFLNSENGKKEFPLTLEDLSILDLSPLTVDGVRTTTLEDVEGELSIVDEELDETGDISPTPPDLGIRDN